MRVKVTNTNKGYITQIWRFGRRDESPTVQVQSRGNLPCHLCPDFEQHLSDCIDKFFELTPNYYERVRYTSLEEV